MSEDYLDLYLDYSDMLQEARDENAKLRIERDEWHRVAESKQDIIDHMRDARIENIKLRELVAGVSHLLFSLDVDYCATCPRDGINHQCPVYTIEGGECLYKTDLRDLGVEVDDG